MLLKVVIFHTSCRNCMPKGETNVTKGNHCIKLYCDSWSMTCHAMENHWAPHMLVLDWKLLLWGNWIHMQTCKPHLIWAGSIKMEFCEWWKGSAKFKNIPQILHNCKSVRMSQTTHQAPCSAFHLLAWWCLNWWRHLYNLFMQHLHWLFHCLERSS